MDLEASSESQGTWNTGNQTLDPCRHPPNAPRPERTAPVVSPLQIPLRRLTSLSDQEAKSHTLLAHNKSSVACALIGLEQSILSVELYLKHPTPTSSCVLYVTHRTCENATSIRTSAPHCRRGAQLPDSQRPLQLRRREAPEARRRGISEWGPGLQEAPFFAPNERMGVQFLYTTPKLVCVSVHK